MYLVYVIIRVILYPFIRHILPLVSSKAKERVQFEHRNHTHVPLLKKAKFGFEVSSEGELQQVLVLIEYLLEKKETVELIFCSDSVEKQCMNLQQKYPENLRIYRLPLITFNPLSQTNNPLKWMTAEHFFMCRYDFFPELIQYAKKNGVKSTLISGTLKNYESKSFLTKLYLSDAYHAFNQIVAATDSDKKHITEAFNLSINDVESYDFRTVKIHRRLEEKNETLNKKFPIHNEFLQILKTYSAGQKLIFGSYWNYEFPVFAKKGSSYIEDGYHCTLVPHDLSAESLNTLKENFAGIDIPVYEINSETTSDELKEMQELNSKQNGVWLLNLRGVLCELYSYYENAYVGGGYGISVHSLLEPFMAGAVVYCGPKTHRSTEHSLISEFNPERIHVFADKEKLLDLVFENNLDNIKSIDSFNSHFIGHYEVLLVWLGLNSHKV